NPEHSIMMLLASHPRSLRDLGASFTTPLQSLKSEIPLDDVSNDVEDFGIVSTLAQLGNGELPVMRMGSKKKPVPVLPSEELSQSVFSEYPPFRSASRARALFEKVMQNTLHDDRIEM